MTEVVMQLPRTVSDERGTFHTRVMARERNDGRWEGWLEFIPPDADGSRSYATPIETHQQDRVIMERWASGLTDVYADGALARARVPETANRESDLLLALQEFVQALDRRVPHLERAGEAKISHDARLLRAEASERIALLQDRGSGPRREEERRDQRDQRGDDTPTPRPNDEVPANRRDDPRPLGRDEDVERKDRRTVLSAVSPHRSLYRTARVRS